MVARSIKLVRERVAEEGQGRLHPDGAMATFRESTLPVLQNLSLWCWPQANPVLADWLLDIGNGVSDFSIDLLDQHIREVHDSLAVIHAFFGTVLIQHTLPVLTHHILCPTNKKTAHVNEQIISMVEGQST
jgi:hypothetical protein